mmetsp:Transcript_14477/g.43498  ORF Transcript_14477/g.43498 Transcript_14477/m.43498 type:complete len:282 (-) Transcript_14477:800-1645(-)
MTPMHTTATVQPLLRRTLRRHHHLRQRQLLRRTKVHHRLGSLLPLPHRTPPPLLRCREHSGRCSSNSNKSRYLLPAGGHPRPRHTHSLDDPNKNGHNTRVHASNRELPRPTHRGLCPGTREISTRRRFVALRPRHARRHHRSPHRLPAPIGHLENSIQWPVDLFPTSTMMHHCCCAVPISTSLVELSRHSPPRQLSTLTPPPSQPRLPPALPPRAWTLPLFVAISLQLHRFAALRICYWPLLRPVLSRSTPRCVLESNSTALSRSMIATAVAPLRHPPTCR